MTETRGWFTTAPLAVASVGALAAFAWPLVFPARIDDGDIAGPVIVVALVPALVVAVALLLDRAVDSAKAIALLGVLAAVGSAVRIASTGVGGMEAVFIVLILAGYAFGPRFGLLLGMLTIATSTILMGGFGPWTAFQMFAAGWVSAGAGLLPRVMESRTSIRVTATLVAYGIVASYLFGAIMNLWFWPFAVGSTTTLGYVPGAPLEVNLEHFAAYTLLTSTLTWDTVRAVTTTIGLIVVGPIALSALRRAKLDRI